MVGCHGVFTQTFSQMPCKPFGKTTCINEYQRGSVIENISDQALINLLPYLVGQNRRQRRVRQYQLDVHVTLVTGIDNRAVLPAAEVICDSFYGFLCGRKANTCG